MGKTLVIIDGHALLYRAYHGMPPLSLPTGESIHAAYGFMLILLNMIKEIKPSHIAVAFDTAGPTFRHERYEHYKATRIAPPEDLEPQLVRLKELLDVFNIPYLEKPGYEADDLIGCITKSMPKGFKAIIVTGDLDELQLVNERVSVYTMRRGFTDTVIYDEGKVEERYGFPVKSLIEYKALKGDPSDNIPGVAGIGEKTAAELIAKYGTLEKVYASLDEISGATAKKLESGKSMAFESRELVRIDCDLDMDFDYDTAGFGTYDTKKVKDALASLGFKSLLPKVPEPAKPKLFEEPEEEREKTKRERYTHILTLSDLKSALRSVPKEILVDIVVLDGKAILSFETRVSKYILTDPDGNFLEHIERNFRGKELIGFGLKSVFRFFTELSTKPKFDLMLAAYLIDSNRKNDTLEDLGMMYLGSELPVPDKKAADEEKMDYAASRLAILKKLHPVLAKQIKELGLTKILAGIELPLTRVLADIERRGVLIDVKYLNLLSSELEKKVEESEKLIYKLSGTKFNIGSPIQLKDVLFKQLNIASAELRRIKTGVSTAASELEKLRGVHPVIDEIFNYRELTKLKSTYVDALPRLVAVEDGRIHTSYNQTVAATGRLSSSNPNLQNIPIRSELGNRIRNAFITDEGYELLAADYSQIELRVAAHLSGDKNMIAAFKNETDFHTNTAAMVYGAASHEITKNQRRVAKAVNFGVLYGQGPHGLSEATGLTFKEAQDYIRKYFELFSGLKRYLDGVKKKAYEEGFAQTPLGRRRPIPELKSPNFAIKNAGERMAINMPIQGMAADIIKKAMIDLNSLLPSAAMILQVHDELVFEIEDGKVLPTAKEIKKIMEGAAELTVPIKVEFESGKKWGELKELKV